MRSARLFLPLAIALAACAAAPKRAMPVPAHSPAIAARASTPPPPPVQDGPDFPDLDIRGASTTYDFQIFLDAPGEGDRASEGDVVVLRKDTRAVVADLHLASILVALDDKGAPLVSTARVYDEQGTVNVGDFDFDGHEDFAVRDGNDGSYGGPSYTVFLYAPSRATFVEAPALGELTHTNLGFFGVDPKRKRLTTFGKSGCCWHVMEEHEVVSGKPIVVARTTEDATGESDVVITEERLVRGKWLRRTTRRAQTR
jgi:hypothetical protein